MKTTLNQTSQSQHLCLIITVYLLTLCSFSFAQKCEGKRYKQVVTSSINSFLDIKYGSNLAQDGITTVNLHLDIYAPKDDTTSSRPLIILAHGGFFSMGTKSDLGWMAKELAKMGYVAATMQYRLLDLTDPAVYLDTPLEFHKEAIRASHDMRAAVRFFRKSVAENNNPYGIDPNMIIVGGYSAGGIMANYTTYLDKLEEIPINLKSYVDEQGGIEGNSGNNGYSSKTQVAISLCGAIGDTTWIQKNDPSFIGLHNSNDLVVPNMSGLPLTSLGVPLQLTIYGAGAIYQRTQNIGISSYYKSEIAINPQTSYHCEFSNEAIDFVLESLYHEICDEQPATSLHDQTNDFFSLYPNPSNDEFYIKIPDNSTTWTINIINSLGQIVFETKLSDTETTVLFSSSDFLSGIYTVQVRSQDGIMGVQKIVFR